MSAARQRAESVAPDLRADRLSSEMVKRVKGQRALGRPSFYNIAREVLIEEFSEQYKAEQVIGATPEPARDAESVALPREFQCRNCAAYVRPVSAFWIDVLGAWYHVSSNNPVLPCGPLRPLGPKCESSTWITHDEDGKLPKPLELHCKLEAGHPPMHYNGYLSWDQPTALTDGDGCEP